MPNFNINIRTASHIADTLVVEKDDQNALRIEMARFVGELLRDHADLIWEDQKWQIDVSDETGSILYVLHLAASDTPVSIGGDP